MSSATTVALSPQTEPHVDKVQQDVTHQRLKLRAPEKFQHQHRSSNLSALDWATLIRTSLQALYTDPPRPLPQAALEHGLNAPRRRHKDVTSSKLAHELALFLYPSIGDSPESSVIKYEKDIVALRHAIKESRRLTAQKPAANLVEDSWYSRIRAQGPWDGGNDPLPLTGAPAVPMPVDISDEDSLRPFFGHLSRRRSADDDGVHDAPLVDKETYYDVDVGVWGKGMLYADGRMDLCKKVVGPPNIAALMRSLKTNTSVRHFLLGNNVIGPVGAQAIADFLYCRPNHMETWYLAGNCIDSSSLERLVNAWISSSSLTNIWLKRNPLGPDAARDVFRLITETPHLRTLDLDQTELGDEGVATLFELLNQHMEDSTKSPLALRNLYLNAVGVSTSACIAIANFLSKPRCQLSNIYLSNNPVGDGGAYALASGLQSNASIRVLSIASSGINTTGAAAIFSALAYHSTIETLNIGQSYATQDLGMRYNYLEDGVMMSLILLLEPREPSKRGLKMLTLGTTALSSPAIELLRHLASLSRSLLVFEAQTIHTLASSDARKHELQLLGDALKTTLRTNVAREYGGLSYSEFEAGEKRFLLSPKDVRFIDSGYRNRDAGLARRGKMVLKKRWDDDGETLGRVMNWEPK